MHSANYEDQLESRFAESGGKLFLVDGLKNRAFTSVKSILSRASISNSLCIVENSKTAKQLSSALYAKQEVKIVESLADFKVLYAEISNEFKNAPQIAERFKKLYPNIIIVLETPHGAPVLHAPLGVQSGKAGEYSDGDNAAFLVSDFLTIAEYSTLIVDNVYGMFRFEEKTAEESLAMKPQQSERVDLMGRSYFTDTSHSYKRMQRLADSSKQVILVSGLVADREVINFYAAASLINSCFSYRDSKAIAKARATDYEDEVDRIFDSISYSQSDETIQSLCLQRAKKAAQLIPSDIEKLGEYSQGNLAFMTKEEIFLRALSVIRKTRPSITNEAALSLLEDDRVLADTVCDIFFTDTLKGDIESRVEHAKIAKMKEEDTRVFLEIFQKYAVYCPIGNIDDRCAIHRIYHDDSGFEDLIRRSSENFDKNEHVYSASHKGSDCCYKCITTKTLLKTSVLRLPLLVVAREQSQHVAAELQKILTSPVEVFNDSNATITQNAITVLDYASFEAISCNLDVGSVVFFDVIADLNHLNTLAKKAIGLCRESGQTPVHLLVSYDDLQGVMIDLWQERWLNSENNLFPIRNDEVYTKGERAQSYREIVSKLNDIYCSFKHLVDGTAKILPKKFAQSFSSAVTDFTLGRAAHVSEMEDDFGFLGKIAPYYSGIFSNSVCVGNRERPFFAERYMKQKSAQRKQTASSIENKRERKRYIKRLKKGDFFYLPETSLVFFNICSKQLHCSCDIKSKDCAVCDALSTNLANRADVFEHSVSEYFTQSLQLLKKMLDQSIKKQGGIISSQSNSTAKLSKLITQLENSYADLKESIRTLPRSKSNPCYMEYTTLLEIKDAVQAIHFEVFIKYYEQLTAVLSQATNEMINSFNATGKGAKSALSAL